MRADELAELPSLSWPSLLPAQLPFSLSSCALADSSPTLDSFTPQYLILYSSISMSKLSSLMDIDEAQLRTQLACLKNKTYNLRWNGTADATAGE